MIYHPSSSKLLLECHADGGEDKPYPDDFICRCKSRLKLYVNYCKKRGILRWDDREEWIQSCTKQSIILKDSPANTAIVEHFMWMKKEYPKEPVWTPDMFAAFMQQKTEAKFLRVLVKYKHVLHMRLRRRNLILGSDE